MKAHEDVWTNNSINSKDIQLIQAENELSYNDAIALVSW